jgi:hypothetical protein
MKLMYDGNTMTRFSQSRPFGAFYCEMPPKKTPTKAAAKAAVEKQAVASLFEELQESRCDYRPLWRYSIRQQ